MDAWACWQGLKCCGEFAEEFDGRPPITVRLVDWADEEGARFGRSLFGSAAFAGKHTIAADRVRADRDGVTLETALKAVRCRCREDRRGGGSSAKAIAAYLELHIEQGPVLEAMGLPLAAVLGTKGVERHASHVSRAGGAFGFDADDGAEGRAGGRGESWRWRFVRSRRSIRMQYARWGA